MDFVMIKNNTDVKNSLSFILDAFQTLFFMFNTAWATTLEAKTLN
jgi:hypothetical protein